MVGESMLEFDCNQMNKLSRFESAETVPRQTAPVSLLIYYGEEQVLRVVMKGSDTAADLLEVVRGRLAGRFDCIAGLCSREGYFTLDYALTMPEFKLAGLRNNQRLAVVVEEVVGEGGGPTLADFSFLACIGEGISSAVYLVRHCGNGRLYALKQIKKEYFREFKTLESVLREKKILSELIRDMPFVTHLEAAFESYRHLNFLLLFYPGGEFFYHLTLDKLREPDAKLCFAEIMLTMEQLHRRKILYRDLKPENIMVDFEGHLHLGDFGLCRINLEREEVAHSQCGSPEYMAYETKEFQGYSYAADFYTMGAIIYEMVKGVPPFYQTHEPPEFKDTSDAFREVVLALIEREPSRRLTSYADLRKCRWLREVDWDKVARREYKMPNRLNLYTNYIHEEFLVKPISNEDLKYEEKYDKLTPFFYLNHDKGALGRYYPDARPPQHTLRPKKKTSALSDHDAKSHRSKSNKSKHSDKSKDSKARNSKSKDAKDRPKREENPFKRKNLKQPNLYTSPQPAHTNARHDTANKSLSKNKPTPLTFNIASNRSPLKFNKLPSAKSAAALKATEYIRELHRDDSKRKKFV